MGLYGTRYRVKWVKWLYGACSVSGGHMVSCDGVWCLVLVSLVSVFIVFLWLYVKLHKRYGFTSVIVC